MQRRFRYSPTRFSWAWSTPKHWVALTSRWGVLLVGSLTLIGCESESFVPPVNPELNRDLSAPAAGTSASDKGRTISEITPEPAKAIEIILGQHQPNEAEQWKSAARAQSGFDKVKIKVSAVDNDRPKSAQTELVGEALARHPRALVVEPADPADSELAAAIDAVRAKGIPVVVVGHALAGSKAATTKEADKSAKSSDGQDGRAALAVIAPNFADSAAQMASALVRVTKISDLDPAGGAIIVVNTAGDPFLADRVTALKEALKGAGVGVVEIASFAADAKAGEKVLKATITAHPKISMVFGVDPTSSSVVREVVSAEDAERLMIAACYTTEDHYATVSRMPHFAAVAEFTPTRVLRKGISTAVALAQGKQMPAMADVRINVGESPIDTNALKAHFHSSTKKSGPQKRAPD